mgnify:FL=1
MIWRLLEIIVPEVSMRSGSLFRILHQKATKIRKELSVIEQLKKVGDKIFQVYFGIGVVAMGLLAILVIFSVIARYFFSLSWKELSEFNVTLFAFTTFWGMGINVLKNEHVIIDILYDRVPPAIKRWLSVVNYLIVLAVDLVFTKQGIHYVGVAGKQISQGMEIPMKYMYGIMPMAGAICAICIVIKIIEFITADISYFAPKNKVLTKETS